MTDEEIEDELETVHYLLRAVTGWMQVRVKRSFCMMNKKQNM